MYVVVKQPNSDIPVYEVKPQTGSGRAQVLHHNLLLPIPCLSLECQATPQLKPHQWVFQSVDDTICSLSGDRDSEQSDVESDVHADKGMVVPKPRTVVPVPTRRTRGLSVTPQTDESNLAQSNGSVIAVHLDSGDVLSSGTGEALSDELVGHGSGIGVLCRFQHCTGHITMGSWRGRGNQYSSLGLCTVNCRPVASNYQLSHLRPYREPNPSLRGGRRECYYSATMAPGSGIEPGGEDSDVSEEVVVSSSSSDSDTDGDIVSVASNTPVPAPRRSTRVKSTAHLRPDFVYNFNQVIGDGQQNVTCDDRLINDTQTREKINFLKNVLELF